MIGFMVTFGIELQLELWTWAWWTMPLVSALRRQRYVNLWVPGQPGSGQPKLHRKPCLETKQKSWGWFGIDWSWVWFSIRDVCLRDGLGT